ncbi:MAG: hypothetical protein AB7O28_12525 [Vicinamibacterales bacterium]
MTRRFPHLAVAAALGVTVGIPAASAQVFGTFRWQMQPYCNSVTLTFSIVAGTFAVHGTDDQCGAPTPAPAAGLASFNADGSVSVALTIIKAGADALHMAAVVSPATGQGTWTDDLGQRGAFVFFGTAPGLSVRPDAPVYFRAFLQIGLNGSFVRFPSVAANTGGGAYDSGTGVYTVPADGYYSIHYSVGWNPGATTGGWICAGIRTPNAAPPGNHVADCVPVVAGSGFVALAGSTILPLTRGNTIGVTATTTGGATLSSSPANQFIVMRIR